jgi:hypothetical protein
MQEKKRLIMKDSGEGFYLFCLSGSAPGLTLNLFGHEKEQGFLIHNCNGITAVLKRTSLRDFCGESAERKLEDPSWVLPEILRHEKVVEKVMACSPVIPARFGTIFSSLAKVEELIRLNRDVVSNFFEQTAGMSEWAVKGVLDRKLAANIVRSSLMEKEKTNISSLPPGKRYFQEKRILMGVDSGVREWIRESSWSILRDLQGHSSRFCELNTLVHELVKEVEVVFNWAFLVAHDSLSGFHDQVLETNHGFANQGLTVEVSGPWPPYSFAPVLSLDAGQN